MKTFAKAFFIYIFNIVFKSKWSIIGTEWRGGLSKLTKTNPMKIPQLRLQVWDRVPIVNV